MESFKTVKEKRECFIEFTEDELNELGWEENQKLSINVSKDNTITIKPWVKIELDTSDWPKEIFQMLVELSLEQDKTVNEIIVDLLNKELKIDNQKTEELICENGNV